MLPKDSQQAANEATQGVGLDAVLADYLRALEGGQPPDEQQILEQHPELAAELRSFFLNRKEMEQFAKRLRPPGESRSSGLRNGIIQYLGDYELLEEIARGGMGVVFKARQVTLNRIVAVKMILSGLLASPADVERFHAEAEAAANLDHPGIVPIFEVGVHEGQHYFSMGYVDGRSLSARVAEGPLPAREAAQLVRTVCDAVQYAHEHQVIHRDLKPANVLLDREGRPRVTDFGLAKRVQDDSGRTATGQVLGTPAYMPPEQAAGKVDLVGPIADVYALGAILFTLLTGRPPFQSASSVDTLRQVLEKEPLAPSELTPGVPRDLETIVLKCLQKSIPQRYASARELAEDLQRFLDGRPILARPVGRLERGWRWCRRNPALSVAAGVSGMLLVAVVVVITLAYFRERDLRGDALNLANEKSKLADEKSKLAAANLGLAHKEADARGTVEKQAAILTRGLFELGVAEHAHGNSATAMAILAKAYELTPENDPLRGGIWKSLSDWNRSDSIRMTHGDQVKAVAFTPDGARVLTGGDDDTAQLWDSHTGKPLGEPLKHGGAVTVVACSPNGATVLTGSTDKTARLWDARTGQPLGEPMKHDGAVTAVAYSPDGATVLTGSEDKTARLWDARTGRPLGEPMKHGHPVLAVAYSPDGATVLTGSANTARLWDARTGKSLGVMIHDAQVLAVAYSPDGTTVLTGSGRFAVWGTARLWDARTGRPLGEPMKHKGAVGSVAFSPDGATVLTGGWDRIARLWDAHTGEPLGEPMQHDGMVHAVAYSPDGVTVLTGSGDGMARLWNARSGEPIGEPMKHNGMVVAIAFSPDGATVLTGSGDHRARLWNAHTDKPLQKMRHGAAVLAAAYSPDGATVLTGSYDKAARLWDARTGKPLGEPMKHGYPVLAVAYSPDGATVLTGSLDRTARLWDANTREPLGEPMKHDGPVRAVAFSPDGVTVLTGSEDKTARLWDARTGKPLGEPMKHDGGVLSMAFSPDGATVLTGSLDRTARLWDARTGRPLGEPLKHDGWVYAVAYSPDGATVLTGSEDKTARLWDVYTREPLGEPMKHDGPVRAVAFSPDGVTVLTGSEDKTARLWDARTGKPFGEPMKHDGFVGAIAYSPDGAMVLTGSSDKTAQLWLVSLPIPKRLIRLVVATRGGIRMNDLGQIKTLSVSELSEMWKTLEAEGADWLAENRTLDQRRQSGWHEYEAAEAEARGDWFAAAFHLQRLADQDPENAVWRQRLATACDQQTITKKAREARAAADLLMGLVAGRRVAVGAKSDWSPDATKLVVTKKETGGTQDNGLEIHDLVSGVVHDLVARGKDPAWSPATDGSIAFVRGSDPAKEVVWLVQPDGTQERQIGVGGYPHWSANGKTLYFHVRNTMSIMAVSSTDSHAEPQLFFKPMESYYPVVSPDGSQAAYIGSASLGVTTQGLFGNISLKSNESGTPDEGNLIVTILDLSDQMARTATVTTFVPSNYINFGAGPGLLVPDSPWGQISGITPGSTTISYEYKDTASVTIDGGSAGDLIVDHQTGIGSFPVTLNATPNVTSISPASGPLGGGTVVAIHGSHLGGASADVLFGSTAAMIDTNMNNTDTEVFAYAPSSNLGGTVDVTVINSFGERSAPSPADQFDYLNPPLVVAVAPAAGPLAGKNTVVITGEFLGGASAVDFGTNNPGMIDSDVQLAPTPFWVLTATAPAGAIGTVHVTMTTPGGPSAPSSADVYTYTAAPQVYSVSAAPSGPPVHPSGPLGGGTTVYISGANLSTLTEVDFGGNPGTIVSHTDTQIVVRSPAGAAGAVAMVVDTLGGPTSIPAAFTYIAPPILIAASTFPFSAVTPDFGPYEGGTTVTITGANLSGAALVTFGGISAQEILSDTDTQLVVVSPAEALGSVVDVRVFTNGGESATLFGDLFNFTLVAPIVSSVSPPSGPLAGGTSVYITGTNLLGTTEVDFGGAKAPSFTVISPTQITATSPAETAGTVDVTVVTPGERSAISANDKYTYSASIVPIVSNLSPSSGLVAGGTTVTIVGVNLSGATAVDFGGVAGTIIPGTNTAMQIIATSPAHAAGTVDVTVVTPNGTSATSPADQFTYQVPGPVVSTVSPSSGSTAGGTSVTVSGSNLSGATVVNFGGTPATSFTVNANGTITATSPAGTTGAVDVTVVTAGGTSALSPYDQFNYGAAPTITALIDGGSLIHNLGPSNTRGFGLYIFGGNLTGATEVDFGAVAGTIIDVQGAAGYIYVTTPSEGPGTVDVRVVTPSGTSAITPADQFTFTAAPFVTNVANTGNFFGAGGPVAGGTSVTIQGYHLSDVTAVNFGNTPAASFTYDSYYATIVAFSPPGAAGTVSVTVTSPEGTSTVAPAEDQFTYYAIPTVSGISPALGPLAGGNSVLITGTNLLGATVYFGGRPLTSFSDYSDSDTSILVDAPAGVSPGTVDVTVVTAGGTTATSAADQYT